MIKRIDVTANSQLISSTYKFDSEYQAWIDANIAAGVWGAVGTYTVNVVNADAEYAQKIQDQELAKASIVDAVSSSVSEKEPTIVGGTVTQYWRGDKTFQPLDGLAVANTPSGSISATTVQAAINELATEKQPTGNYITALTGDVSASGPGSVTATLSNTGVVAGSYNVVTVDAKGRVTNGSTTGAVTRYANSTSVATSNTTITYTTVAALTTVSLPVGLYFMRFAGNAQSAATANGIGIRLAPVTATLTTVAIKWNLAQGANGVSHDFEYDQIAAATNLTSASAQAANTDFGVNGMGTFRVTVAGTVAIQIRSENAGTAITLQPDAALIVELV